MASPQLKAVIDAIDRRNPEWKVGPTPGPPYKMLSIFCNAQMESGVLNVTIETTRWEHLESSKIVVLNYCGARLDEKGKLSTYYDKLETIFEAGHGFECKFQDESLFRKSGWKRPTRIPEDHDFLLQYVDKIAKPELAKREAEERDRQRQKDQRREACTREFFDQ